MEAQARLSLSPSARGGDGYSQKIYAQATSHWSDVGGEGGKAARGSFSQAPPPLSKRRSRGGGDRSRSKVRCRKAHNLSSSSSSVRAGSEDVVVDAVSRLFMLLLPFILPPESSEIWPCPFLHYAHCATSSSSSSTSSTTSLLRLSEAREGKMRGKKAEAPDPPPPLYDTHNVLP